MTNIKNNNKRRQKAGQKRCPLALNVWRDNKMCLFFFLKALLTKSFHMHNASYNMQIEM